MISWNDLFLWTTAADAPEGIGAITPIPFTSLKEEAVPTGAVAKIAEKCHGQRPHRNTDYKNTRRFRLK
jgi:hypothetical protein